MTKKTPAKRVIGIVIVHFNSDTETTACLASLSKVRVADALLHVYIIDNGSKHPFQLNRNTMGNIVQGTTLLRSDANLGFASGNNWGMREALKDECDWIMLLNSDTVIDAQCVTELLAAAERWPDAGMLTPKIYFYPGCEFFKESYSKAERGRVLWYGGGSIDWSNLLVFHRGVDEVDRGHFDHEGETDFATGCCVLLRREAIERVGMFDPKYFLYFEDTDLSLRMILGGYKVLYIPRAVVWHKNASSSGGAGSQLQQYYQTRNRLYFSFLYGTNRVRFTTVKLAIRLLIEGKHAEQRAVQDFIFGRMGKQSVL
jgi:GT2 family glycosyltransferase